ncbi:cytochrome c-type biogenesis protein CcmH [Exilibacterium tricleocarpae]|uniref:Cytochrome c-type biogenesis protein n=1 Tax=Exilibacterium tricleocarpae TaxID=2591008 RepID=A0A545TM87_9GAMM|nr:cytochrome c-type biogenesis protein [Exilibacterium tricleocarpae]TQV78288.1 cytochrome c-type biogenesis protein CcmH [Exilibacterium tricleocarpae]
MLVSLPALAAVDVYDFSSETERQRYRYFVEELRCPKCQNQNLAGSDAPIAKDLRRELYRLLQEGKSDPQIVDFMVSRYGDYVLYRPPLQRNTAVLWGLPLVLVGLGMLVFALILRRRRVRTDAGDTLTTLETLTEQERRQLEQLLTSEEGAPGSSTQDSKTQEKG